MHVDITHHVDASAPDDQHGYYYAYTLYRFDDGRDRLLARSYDDEADQAHFLSITVDGRARTLTDADLRHPLLLAAAAYLGEAGKRRLRWLSGRGDGYEPLPDQPTIGPAEAPMKRVTGIGGIFFKAQDPAALQAWYQRHLGIDVQAWGGTAFAWNDGSGAPVTGSTVWSIGSAAEEPHFAPGTAAFMLNYRVHDLHALVAALREEGCHVLDRIDESEYGAFAWVIDPEGNKVELWQPPAGQ